MRNFINWIRQAFCKHEFEYEERRVEEKWEGRITKQGDKVSRTCKKCGWHKSYWKF